MSIGFSEFVQSFRCVFFDGFFNTVSFLGEEYMYIILICILYFAIDKKLGEFMGLALFFSFVLNNTLKGLIMSERPFVKYPGRIVEIRPSSGSSFPSGHTQGFTAFLFSGAFWLKKRYVFAIAGVLSLLMALSRVYLGVHWLEDVLAGLILGLVAAYLLYKYYSKHKDDAGGLIKLYVIILIFFLPFLFFTKEDDMFKTYGLSLGFTVAMYLEKRFVNFSLDVPIWKKILRVVFAILAMVIIITFLGESFDRIVEEGTLMQRILYLVRYGLVSFVGLGCSPFVFEKLNL